MILTREKKKQIVENLKSLLDKQKAIIFADFHGLKTDELLELKKRLKASQNIFKVTKKTLLQIAFKEKGFKDLGETVRELYGQLATIFSLQDEVQVSKILIEFAKNRPNFKILGGVFDKMFQGPEMVEKLASLPSPQDLKTKLVSTIAYPLNGLVWSLKANLSKLITIFLEIKNKKGQ